jgi:hypothetical protein
MAGFGESGSISLTLGTTGIRNRGGRYAITSTCSIYENLIPVTRASAPEDPSKWASSPELEELIEEEGPKLADRNSISMRVIRPDG